MKLLVLFVGLSLSLNVVADEYWSKLFFQSKGIDNQSQFQLNVEQLKQDLSRINDESQTVISLPRSDGSISQFNIWQTFVVADELLEKYPNYKTYKIEHISDSQIHGRLELMNDNLSAVIKASAGQEFIKISDQSNQFYQARNKSFSSNGSFSCGAKASNQEASLALRNAIPKQNRAAVNQLTELKLAVATTVEYSSLFGNTKPLVLAQIMTAVNRVNEVFEADLSITLKLVANNEDIIFINNDSFSNNDASLLIDQVQTVISNTIGAANYDLGHVFSTGGGGLASVASVCDDNVKANGVTGSSNPTTDSFWIDFVAHEMGHQLGAEHSFNGTTASCEGANRIATSAYEPGSGSTIMAYASICGAENLQSNSDDSFHSRSVLEIDNSIPSNCGTAVSYSTVHLGDSNGNAPTIAAASDRTIPTNTAFVLSAAASDLDGDTLFYQWDETDKGTATSLATIGCDLKDNGLFRSNKPKTENIRYFPTIQSLLNAKAYIGETLPTTSRDINFTVKVTDSKGGYVTDDLTLTSTTSASSFKVTSQASVSSFVVNDVITVHWDVANTSSTPVNCAAVDIQLLSFSSDKSTFTAQTLSSGDSNSGSAVIRLPSDGNSSASRFLVKCTNNVFFAINQADFSITGGLSSASNSATSSSGGIVIGASTEVDSSLVCPVIAETITETPAVSSGGGGGGLMPYWLLCVLSLMFIARRRV